MAMRFSQIDFQDAIEPGQRENNSAFGGHRAAGKAGPRAARHDRHVGLLRRFDDGGDLFDVAGHHDDLRHDLKDRAVLLVDDDIFFLDQKIMLADDRAQLANESCPGLIAEEA